MGRPYEVQAAVLTPIALVLLLLFLRQTYIALMLYQLKKDARRHGNDSSRSSVRSLRRSSAKQLVPDSMNATAILKNFRQNALMCGTLNAFVMCLYSMDSGRVNGIWDSLIVTTLFSKILTCSSALIVVSYVVAVTSASYTATQLNQPEPEQWYRIMAYVVWSLCLTAFITTLLSAAGVNHAATYRPYLALTVFLELVCIISLAVAYFPFMRAVAHLRNPAIEAAVTDMRRVFALGVLFTVVAPPYQIWYIVEKADDRSTPHDPDSYEVRDQFALYFVFFVTTCTLYVVWQRLPDNPTSSMPNTPTQGAADSRQGSLRDLNKTNCNSSRQDLIEQVFMQEPAPADEDDQMRVDDVLGNSASSALETSRVAIVIPQ